EAEHRTGPGRADVGMSAKSAATRAEFSRLLDRRLRGEPLQHVLGHWSFRTIDIVVDRRALIPRSETEIVVEYALAELSTMRCEPLVVDLGTGSGAIACAIASEHATASILATDVSVEALELARANRDRLDARVARRVELRLGDWYTALQKKDRGKVNLVVSNPPYVAEDEWAGLDPVVRDYDPRLALVAGPRGTEAIFEVISGAPGVLAAGGSVVVEIAPWQASAVRDFALQAGAKSVEIRRDLAVRLRVLVARW
ncbi:MAG: peptide chain release factor N(5)-glutamine methyltransferase, partial [Acidimicrobiales bacterium]